ncbi:hypothetical protein QCA50_018557 [Cerrena zonata]|uniref:Uncharacterized protein n=1 Tax=Cerrena zonata TaxID=2478898 RepID=A0AAW0FME3_9APHY
MNETDFASSRPLAWATLRRPIAIILPIGRRSHCNKEYNPQAWLTVDSPFNPP